MAENTENSTPDDIPAITYRKTACTEKYFVKKYGNEKVAKFFISDLLNAKQGDDKLFEVRGITFKTVMLCGIVVELEFYSDGEKLKVTIHDGTGAIDCILEENNKVDSLKNDTNKLFMEVSNMQKENSNNNDIVLQASMMMLSAAKHKLKRIPYSLKMGDTVQLIGNFREYNNERRIYISTIVKEDVNNVNSNIEYLCKLYYLYDNFYTK